MKKAEDGNVCFPGDIPERWDVIIPASNLHLQLITKHLNQRTEAHKSLLCKSKSSLKSLKNKSLMSLLVGMSLLSSAEKTGQLYLRNSKYFLYYYNHSIIYQQS